MLPIPPTEQTKRWIIPGDFGIWQTLLAMKKLALSASRNIDFQKFAVGTIGCPASDPTTCLERYVFQNVRYLNDPEEFEYVKDPILMMNEIKNNGFTEGDCDDHVTLLSSLLTLYGVHNSMIAMQIPEMQEDTWNHVVNGLPIGGGQYKILDTSVKDGVLDYSIGDSMRVDVY